MLRRHSILSLGRSKMSPSRCLANSTGQAATRPATFLSQAQKQFFTMNVGDYLPGAGSLTTQFPVVASCPNDVCSEVQVPSVTIPFSFPTINSDKAPTDMPIPLISSNSISGQGAFSGIFKISGKVTVDIKYDELTDSTYVQEALDHVDGTGPSKGSVMLQLITELRNNDPGTSSTNLNLRDAQVRALWI